MPELKVPIICGDKIDINRTTFEASFEYTDALPVNMTGVLRESMSDSGYLLSHDGLNAYATGFGADRGALYNERWARSFRVSGTRFIEIKPDGSVVDIGEIEGFHRVSMDYSFQSIMIVCDGKAWRYDGTTLLQMTDPDLGNPRSVTWIDSYYVFQDGEYIFHTDISDETSISPLKYATSELSPDPTKAVTRTQDDLLLVFNRYTCEFFVNRATENFAFGRLNQKALNCGTVGTHSWCEMDGNIFILGGRKEESPSVHIIGAGQTTSIATRYIDKLIAQYSEVEMENAVLECRIQNRDKFLYVRLPSITLCYNHTIASQVGVNSAWSIIQSRSGVWRACNGVYDPRINKWVYGDASTNKIGYLNPSSAAQYGEAVTQEFYSPLIPLETASIDEVEIDTVSGSQSSETFLHISSTRDGFIYSTEWSREVAKPLKYGMRCIFRRQGYVRKNIGFKFRTLTTEKINASGMVVRYG
jgi:hypothetical protein